VADDCLFCRIAAGEIPVERLREDDDTLVFPDINPQAPTHVLVISKRHFRDISELAADAGASAAVLAAIRGFTADSGFSSFRTVFNTGAEAGQSVFHVHAHVLAGRPMGWPPG
jgi:histidine triad (HIT) family protein